jgi:hypothetical protein
VAIRRRTLASLAAVLWTCTTLTACGPGLGAAQGEDDAPPPIGVGSGSDGDATVSDASSGAAAGTSASVSPGLPGCLVGSWSAPIARETRQMNLPTRTKGALARASGTARLNYTATTFVFTFDTVSLEIRDGGTVSVTGSLDGTYRLAGARLDSTITRNAATVSLTVGGTSVPVENAFNGIATSLAPTDVTVACTPGSLAFTQEDGSVVTFDRV